MIPTGILKSNWTILQILISILLFYFDPRTDCKIIFRQKSLIQIRPKHYIKLYIPTHTSS